MKIKDRVKFWVRVRVRSRVKIRVRIRARVKVRVRVGVKVRVSVSYIMTIWKWEEFSRCDKFPTTPVRSVIVQLVLLQCSYVVRDLLLAL